jgi:hypothetical protein
MNSSFPFLDFNNAGMKRLLATLEQAITANFILVN